MNSSIARQKESREIWGQIANELHWFRKWDKVLEWTCPGQSGSSAVRSIFVHCLDRHVATWAQKQSRDHLGRRARRSPNLYLINNLLTEAEVANVLKQRAFRRLTRSHYSGQTPELPTRCRGAADMARLTRCPELSRTRCFRTFANFETSVSSCDR